MNKYTREDVIASNHALTQHYITVLDRNGKCKTAINEINREWMTYTLGGEQKGFRIPYVNQTREGFKLPSYFFLCLLIFGFTMWGLSVWAS